MFNATPLLKAYAKYRLRKLSSSDPAEVQKKQLLSLVERAKNTRFGKEHDFARIHSIEDFQKAVPLRNYEDFWEQYWKESFPVLQDLTWPGKIPYFAMSSGTSSDITKNIPVSAQMASSNSFAAAEVLVHHLEHKPDSRVFAGKNFIMGGSTDLPELAPGVRAGDLSGIAVREIPFFLRSRSFPPMKLALEKDWERKLEVMSDRALHEDIRSISGTPAWLLLLFHRMFEKSGQAGERRLKEIFPALEIIAHGGVNFLPYKERFEQLLEGSRAELREVYPASEGFLAVADRGSGQGLRLLYDNGIFFEFVPVEELSFSTPTRHTIHTAELDVNYAVVVSTNAGLWSYVIGDTVKFVDKNIPRILITGRISYGMSAFGEHLLGAEIEQSVSRAAQSNGLQVIDYSMGAVYPRSDDDPGHHRYYVEFREGIPEDSAVAGFARDLDRYLSETNEDYSVHRKGGVGMTEPEVIAVPEGAFASWMKKRGRLGGQNKVPRVINDPELLADLESFMQESLQR